MAVATEFSAERILKNPLTHYQNIGIKEIKKFIFYLTDI